MKPRTSLTDPIRVDFIPAKLVGKSAGRIGLTIAPGKKDSARSWDRDLDNDVQRLRQVHGADVLVSLMEDHEHALLGIPDLEQAAVGAGIEVLRFPIVDVDVPKASEMPAFADLVDGIAAAIRTGKTVIVHCRGGLGRSGIVVASVLVELGHRADAAIAMTREARPGAIETRKQEQWISTFEGHRAKASGPRVVGSGNLDVRGSARPLVPNLSAFRGTLLGGALGDALGYPIEFDKIAKIQKRHGASPPEALNFNGGDLALVSDDTQMTMFTAEGLIRARLRMARKGICNPTAVVGFALLRWYETQGGRQAELNATNRGWLVEDRRMHAQRAPGNTCMSALGTLIDEHGSLALPSVEAPPNDSKGCGAVMRAAPCGLAMSTREAAFELAKETSVLTHGHPSGYLSAAYFAALIWDLSRGADLPTAMTAADELLASQAGRGELEQILGRVKALAVKGVPDGATIESLGGGWTGEEALAIALLCALTADPDERIEPVLWRAAAHSGDSDSTAAITGNLLGAMRGVGVLPPAWLAVLELRDIIERLASDLFSAWIESEDLSEYPGV